MENEISLILQKLFFPSQGKILEHLWEETNSSEEMILPFQYLLLSIPTIVTGGNVVTFSPRIL